VRIRPYCVRPAHTPVEPRVPVDRKRRRLSLAWSLPLVVAIMCLVVAKLAALQRADVIRELDKRVSHGSTDEATDAVRNLATIPRPPLALLVKAAASPNLEVAREAQQAIDDYLKFCQREVKARRNAGLVARQLAVLAQAMAIEQPKFTPADHPWLERTTRNVLRLANGIKAGTTPLVASLCDQILVAVAKGQVNSAPPSTTAVKNLSLVGSAAVPVTDSAPDTDDRFTALAARAWGAVPDEAREAGGIAIPITLRGRNTNPPPHIDGLFTNAGEADLLPPGELNESGWKAEWTHPVLQSLPSAPVQSSPAPGDSAESSSPYPPAAGLLEPRILRTANDRFEGIADRALLKRWLVGAGPNTVELEQELLERGFGRLSRRLVQQLFSERVEDRLQLVDEVLTEPAIDARPWLLVLADDVDADVRLVAITLMATSNDPALIDKAWQVVLRDHDPRIAGLAERLRQRRGAARRR
jgi:hypothetical protein